eukprot:GEMP01031336.1.p1 GENE.GEMP01031336.1~~GEMP01031336.1.p1  ORF type:complete len:533 (+),score=121.83 GEMP01031336.1:159-1757(+)
MGKWKPAPGARKLHKQVTRRPLLRSKCTTNAVDAIFVPVPKVCRADYDARAVNAPMGGVLHDLQSIIDDARGKANHFVKQYGGRLLGGSLEESMELAENPISTSTMIKGVFLPGIAASLWGIDFGSAGAAIHSLQMSTDWVDTPFRVGLVIASASGGALLGSTAAYFGAKCGPRKMLIIGGLAALLGGITQATAPSLPLLILGRIIYGFAQGIISIALPQYVADLAPADKRAGMIGWQEVFFVGGIFGGALYAHRYADSAKGWRAIWGLPAGVALVTLIGLLAFLDETPRSLLMQGGTKAEAFQLLRKLRNAPDRALRIEVDEIAKSIRPPPPRTLGEAINMPEFGGWEVPIHQKLLLSGVLASLLQSSGHFSLLYYAPQILKLQHASPFKLSLLLYGCKLLMTIPAVFVLDFFKRRTLLQGGLVGMAASYGALAYFQHGGVSILAALANVAIYQCSIGPITWILSTELFPAHLRFQGGALVLISNALFNTAIIQAHPLIFARFGVRLRLHSRDTQQDVGANSKRRLCKHII